MIVKSSGREEKCIREEALEEKKRNNVKWLNNMSVSRQKKLMKTLIQAGGRNDNTS
jgi:hypothetical protein